MSAFMCSNEHINALVDAAIKYPGQKFSFYYPAEGKRIEIGEQELGQLLADENARSLGALYGDRADDAAGFEFRRVRDKMGRRQPLHYIKLLNGYDYQACESEDYRETKAKAAVDAIEAQMIRAMPGYDEAPWAL